MFEYIEKEILNNDVVLFMKGTKDFPQCGFSAKVVHILKSLNLEFKDLNVLQNEQLRADIKKFSNWVTIPQLYIKGKFIGGSDIVTELFQRGELKNLLSS